MNGTGRVQLVTQSEYARRRGVAKSAVAKAVKEGRMSLIDGLVDPAVADIQWANNTRARADGGRPAAPAPGTPAVEAPPVAPLPQGPASPPPGPDYSKDRARREGYEADMAEMKLRELQGDLVRVVEVRAEIAKRAGQVRMNLMQIAARLAPQLAVETDQAKVHAMLDAELRAALRTLTSGAD